MLFILIIVVFSGIAYISFRGNKNERCGHDDKADWERINGSKYK